MARILPSFPNIQAPDGDYPFGRIKDKTAGANGTPVNEYTNGDIHQFFAKLMDEAGITANGLPDNDYSGFQLFVSLQTLINALISAGTSLKTNGIIEVGAGINIKTKVVEIGDWDMDATDSKSVTHGIAVAKVRSISVVIRDDGPSFYRTFPYYNESSGAIDAWITNYAGASIGLKRRTGGAFDSTDYNSTSYNRGWVYITYEE